MFFMDSFYVRIWSWFRLVFMNVMRGFVAGGCNYFIEIIFSDRRIMVVKFVSNSCMFYYTCIHDFKIHTFNEINCTGK